MWSGRSGLFSRFWRSVLTATPGDKINVILTIALIAAKGFPKPGWSAK
jgi:hypothetical protein